jgi:hypothetical protein
MERPCDSLATCFAYSWSPAIGLETKADIEGEQACWCSLNIVSDGRAQLPLLPLDFSRFDLYAPFVKGLHIFSQDRRGKRCAFGIDDSWQPFIFRARQSALLPNLQTLSIDEKFRSFDETAFWVSAFVSPSLTCFDAEQLELEDSALTASNTTIILQLVLQGCPGLRELKLHLGPPEVAEQGEHALSTYSLLNAALGTLIFHSWQGFHELQYLATDICSITGDFLLSLGQLASLVTFDIYRTKTRHSGSKHLSVDLGNVDLPKGSFPNLRCLAIRDLRYDDIFPLWNLDPMVGDLERVKVVIDLSENISSEQAQKFASEFFPVLSVHSPGLTELVFGFGHVGGIGLVCLDVGVCKPLAALPLRRVELLSILIDSEDMSPDDIDRSVAALWPSVVTLKLPDQYTYFNYLHHFAILPNLLHLVLDVRWIEKRGPPKPTTLARQALPLSTLKFSHQPGADSNAGLMEHYAKYATYLRLLFTAQSQLTDSIGTCYHFGQIYARWSPTTP